MIYAYKDYIIWFSFYIFGTIYLYYFGIKNDWQELRIKQGLVKCNSKNPPRLTQKCIFEIMSYNTKCIKLFSGTAFLSLLIIVSFYVGSSNRSFNNLLGGCTTFLSVVFIYSLFAGAPIDNPLMLQGKDEKAYTKMLNIISYIKKHLIKSLNNAEYEHYQNTITSKIKGWYEKDDIKLGALIIRIDSDFFNEMLPKEIDIGIKEMMKDASFNILNLYNEEDITLLDKLIKLFEDEMLEHGTKIIDLAEFINNHESASKRIKKAEIKQCIEKHIDVHKGKNIRTTSLVNVENIISKYMPKITKQDSVK